MFKNTWLTKWYDSKIKELDSNFERHKTTFEILLTISLGIVLLILPILPKGVDMTTIWQYWVLVVFIWVSAFCIFYLIRNSRKKTDNTEKKLDEITKSINDLVIEIRKDRDERNKPK